MTKDQQYEQQKAELIRKISDPKELEKALKELAKKLNI